MLFLKPQKVTTMHTTRKIKYISIICAATVFTSCVPSVVQKTENKNTPDVYRDTKDTVNTAKIQWREFFKDKDLAALIDMALKNNQELNIILQDINIAQNEVRARKGAYLPFVGVGGGAGFDKTARYTRQGSVDATNQIEPGKEFPDPLPDYFLAANISWEVDIWKKLRNARKSALYSYLSTT